MKRLVPFLILLGAQQLHAAAKTPVIKREFLSEVYSIDKKYRSMEGPGSTRFVYLGDRTADPELLWLVGVKTEMVAEDGKRPQLPELMCHVNVDFESQRHRMLFDVKRYVGVRVVTLSQGLLETHTPDGYGFPISSSEPLSLFTQVLNHNIDNPKNLKVRHRVTFEYVRDRDLKEPMIPLLNIGASGMVLLDNNPLAVPVPVDLGGAHGATCLMAPRAPNARGASDYTDPQGRKLTGHWIVPPGRQENHTDITWFMSLPFDSRLHYAAVHLHPFAESLTFRDVTQDKTIFTAAAKNPKEKIGLDHVDSFMSAEGVTLYKDHKYELVSVYNNPTKTTSDSMASIFLGIEDREFVKPTVDELAARTHEVDEKLVAESAVLQTSAGEFGINLSREWAPRTSRQFARLVRNGALRGAIVTKIEREGTATLITFRAPMTAQRRKLVQRLPLERGLPHLRGTLSLCPEDADGVTFQVVLGKDEARDGRCTGFAEIGPGSAALQQIAGTPRDASGKPLETIEIIGGELIEQTAALTPSM